jgi:hypothetical protein
VDDSVFALLNPYAHDPAAERGFRGRGVAVGAVTAGAMAALAAPASAVTIYDGGHGRDTAIGLTGGDDVHRVEVRR